MDELKPSSQPHTSLNNDMITHKTPAKSPQSPLSKNSPEFDHMEIPTIFSSVLIIIIIVLTFSPSSSASTPMNATPPPGNQSLVVAIAEMQKANYFAFVMLINMSPVAPLFGNVTFLMPNDRILSQAIIPSHTVPEFLQRHAVPSPLLIDHLLHIPTGSVLPSLDPGFSLTISNHGRRNFSVNNVRIISPNICVSGYSIRCHGVDGVMQNMVVEDTPNRNSSPCQAADQAAPPATPLPPVPLPSGITSVLNPPPAVVALPPAADEVRQKSDSSGGISCGVLMELVGMLCCAIFLPP